VRTHAAAIATLAFAFAGASAAGASTGSVTVRYATPAALHGLQVTLRVDALHVAEVKTSDPGALRARPGIVWVRPTVARARASVGATVVAVPAKGSLEWQYAATRTNIVPATVLHAASRITIAVIDTGADLSSPELAPKAPLAYSVVSGSSTVTDLNGHGTFVASIAGGSTSRGALLQGFGGDAHLMIVQANSDDNDFTDANEAAAIVWAVDHGAQIVNLSLGGRDTSQVEQDAVAYAGAHGVLVVAAAGNDGRTWNAAIYPAALLGGGVGLAVAASTAAGTRAGFSTEAPYIALAAPGVNVLGALSSTSQSSLYPRAKLPGLYGYGTGTSYAAPQVAGAAALVWAANPALSAAQVMQILEQTASRGRWTPGLGFGVIDVAAAVAVASGRPVPPVAKTVPKVITVPLAVKPKSA
jgi:serine protease